MPLVTTEAIVLQTHAYSETSKILRLLTRSHGVRSAIARGALRPRSRYGGVLEPFSVGTATFYLKDGRELQTLSAFELIRTGQPLGSDLIRFGAASLLAELVLKTASEEADPLLFERVDGALRRLAETPRETLETVALAETWALVGHLGFAPTLDVCTGCERDVEPEEDVAFDYAEGGVRCTDCVGLAAGRMLPAHARAALVEMTAGHAPELERTAAHWMLLARFLAYHVVDGARLRALDFLTETIRTEPVVIDP